MQLTWWEKYSDFSWSTFKTYTTLTFRLYQSCYRRRRRHIILYYITTGVLGENAYNSKIVFSRDPGTCRENILSNSHSYFRETSKSVRTFTVNIHHHSCVCMYGGEYFLFTGTTQWFERGRSFFGTGVVKSLIRKKIDYWNIWMPF